MLRLVPDVVPALTWCQSEGFHHHYELRSGDLHFATLVFRARSMHAAAHTAEGSWFLSPRGIFRRRIAITSSTARPDIAEYWRNSAEGNLRFSCGESLLVRFDDLGLQCRFLDNDHLELLRLCAHDRLRAQVNVTISRIAWSRSDIGLLLNTALFCLLLHRPDVVAAGRATRKSPSQAAGTSWRAWLQRIVC